tara:strand:+ start:272 stop:520 length:249 start_codon:yes stop_codon:yes gene_type:complete
MNDSDKMMYGCDIEAFKESVKQSFTYKATGGYMVIASLLSDAQEQLAHGNDFQARQILNIAKAFIFDMADGDMTFNSPKETT